MCHSTPRRCKKKSSGRFFRSWRSALFKRSLTSSTRGQVLSDHSVTEQILDSTTSGDASVNDCTVQPLIHELPFGGVGNSGMGKYHGEWGFRAYTNARGILYHSTRIDPGVRYPP